MLDEFSVNSVLRSISPHGDDTLIEVFIAIGKLFAETDIPPE